MASDIRRVRDLTADNQEQQRDLDRVSADVKVKLEELARAIQQRQASGFAAAQAIVVTNLGKRTMDGIRVVVARMEAREDALLATRSSAANRAYSIASLT